MGTHCAPLVADLSLYCYERDYFLCCVSTNNLKQMSSMLSMILLDIWTMFFNTDNLFFDNKVQIIYPEELKLSKAKTSDTSAVFLDLYLSNDNGAISSKTYDKLDDFDFSIVNDLFFDGDFPRAPHHTVFTYLK